MFLTTHTHSKKIVYLELYMTFPVCIFGEILFLKHYKYSPDSELEIPFRILNNGMLI